MLRLYTGDTTVIGITNKQRGILMINQQTNQKQLTTNRCVQNWQMTDVDMTNKKLTKAVLASDRRGHN